MTPKDKARRVDALVMDNINRRSLCEMIVNREDDLERVRSIARRVVTLDEDGAVGTCRCGSCGKSIDPFDAFCRRCGARLREVSVR